MRRCTEFDRPARALPPAEGNPAYVIPVLVVDDHQFFRSCLLDLIDACEDLTVVGECSDGEQVLTCVRELRPSVVLMDVRMPHLSGLEAAAILQRQQPLVPVVLLTSDTTESSQARARSAGVTNYLIKGASPDLVLDAIRHAARTAPGAGW